MAQVRIAQNEADVLNAFNIERKSYSPDAAASLEAFVMRKRWFGSYFWIAEEAGEVVGVTNGVRIHHPELSDESIKQAGEAATTGAYFCVLTVAVDADHQRKGIGSKLMLEVINQARRDKLKAVVLMCEEHLIGFYEKLGFVYVNPSASTHGGIQWHEMILTCAIPSN